MTTTGLRSTTTVSQPDLRSTSAGVALRSSLQTPGFKSAIPAQRRFNVSDLFKFSRGRGDLLFSALFLAAALFLGLSFFGESGWADRDLPQRRLGKELKQPWVGPLIAVMVLLPAALANFPLSLRRARPCCRYPALLPKGATAKGQGRCGGMGGTFGAF